MNSIDSTYYLENHMKQERSTGSSSLGKDDFLKILMTQMQNQSPLDPMKDKDFVAQMAQFTQLEQMTNMSSSFQEFFEGRQAQVVEYSHMIAKEISYLSESDTGGEGDTIQTGVVEAVSQKDGNVSLKLSDGTSVPVSLIQEVRNPESGDE
ncbi:flagellar hook assembly protein FlgD [Salimicrobium halophilum]|uniref:Flagellar basal-body rod modification protein FlgD n=1 Tax=Salimicrobium halophilum TaxID=86666 RepID=A0A1G8QCI2_9BACI|nr:flagellar hook assembly protein FlgD [Salimicrobium halophilum]SDJ01790.1 flagellar basal-body rod modification protein FlgD [Salimicrobium halophilum]